MKIFTGFLTLSLATHGAALLGWSALPREVATPQHNVLHLVVLDAGRPETGVQKQRPKPLTTSGTPVISASPTIRPRPEPAQIPAQIIAAPEPPVSHEPIAPAMMRDALSIVDTVAEIPSPSDIGDAKERILSRLRQMLDIEKIYPMLALRQGWQGDVLLAFQIAANGNLEHIHVVHSSGHALLDQSALSALHRIGRVPGASNELYGAEAHLEFLVRYQLSES